MKIIRIILCFPFSLLYGIIIVFRNFCFDKGIFSSSQFNVPVIAVGNLSAGGTGKTPMTEYIAYLLLQQGLKTVVLSRGYRRKTKGFIEADNHTDASQIGDEPYQVFRKIRNLKVFVCENRKKGIEKILELYPETKVILLDDAYQHRWVKPGLNILLTSFDNPYFADFMIPSGYLREFSYGKNRADMIVVTKCPGDLKEDDKSKFKSKISPDPGQQLFFSYLDYGDLVQVNGEKIVPVAEFKNYSALVFTGIGNAVVLKRQAEKWFRELIFLNFADHHEFNLNDFRKIRSEFDKIPVPGKIIITTEKDMRRFENTAFGEAFRKQDIYYLPVKINFNENERLIFENQILNYAGKNKGNG